MSSSENIREITVKEYQPVFLEKKWISEECGLLIHEEYNNKLTVEFPTRLNQYQWKITPSSWVGYIQVHDLIPTFETTTKNKKKQGKTSL